MPTLTRSDALPEFHQYVDEGCVFHSACLTCPALGCRFDTVGGLKALRNRERDPAIVQDYRELRLPADVVAQRYGVSKRTVWRVVAGARGLLHV